MVLDGSNKNIIDVNVAFDNQRFANVAIYKDGRHRCELCGFGELVLVVFGETN